jgi:predicted AAA+ superfamily ATPase
LSKLNFEAKNMFKRAVYHDIFKRTLEPRRVIQILAGPRHAGKTTLARQLMEEAGAPSHYASADEPALENSSWLEQQWESARFKAKRSGAVLLV